MSDEKAMETNEYLSCALSIGEGLLISGAEINRVEDTIKRICTAFGAQRVDVFSITSSIVVTISSPEWGTLTQTRRVDGMQYNMHRLEMLNQLSRKICSANPLPSSEEIRADLEKIDQVKGYPFWQITLLYALVAAAFSLFFGGSLRDAISSAIIGIALKFIQTGLGNFRINPFVNTFICSILGGLFAVLLVKCHLGQSFNMITIGDIMLLIPGIALTNGIRNMFGGDMISGLLRFIEALILAAIIAFAFVLTSVLV